MSLIRLATPAHRPRIPGAGPVFVVPGIAGTVFPLHALATTLEADRPCFALQARGVDGRREPLDCVEAMAAAAIDEIHAIGGPARWLLAGWSFGGLVVFEMGIQLEQAGLPACVALIDCRAIVLRSIDRTPQAAPVMSDDPSPFIGKNLEACSRAHSSAPGRYHPSHFGGPLLILRAEGSDDRADPTLGFGRYAGGAVDLATVPGTHETLLHTPHVEVVANHLRDFFHRFDP